MHLKLKNVTLFCVDCKFYEKSIISLKKSSKHIEFGEILFLSDKRPVNIDDTIKHIPIEPLNNLIDYSVFMLRDLPKYINTEYAMCVHNDGWIIHPKNWRDEFLDYDYIGAPWVKTQGQSNDMRVGNGGVSIRSKKLMDIVASSNIPRSHEDTVICFDKRKLLTSNGCKFAPLDVAKYFSMERPCDDLDVTFDDIFAFHGRVGSKDHINKQIEMDKEYNEIFQ